MHQHGYHPIADSAINPSNETNDGLDALPPNAGVYILMCHDPELTQDLRGKSDQASCTLYVGRAANLYKRMRLHLRGPSAGSTFRASLGLVLQQRLGLQARAADVGGAIWFDQEDRLSEWISKHVTIEIIETADGLAREATLIRRLQPLLNIQMRHRRGSAMRLARARFALRQAHRESGQICF